MFSADTVNFWLYVPSTIFVFLSLTFVFQPKIVRFFLDPLVYYLFYLSCGISLALTLLFDPIHNHNYLLILLFNLFIHLCILHSFLPDAKKYFLVSSCELPRKIVLNSTLTLFAFLALVTHLGVSAYNFFTIYFTDGFTSIRDFTLSSGRNPITTILSSVTSPILSLFFAICIFSYISSPRKVIFSSLAKITIFVFCVSNIFGLASFSRSLIVSLVTSLGIFFAFFSFTPLITLFRERRIQKFFIVMLMLAIFSAIIIFAFVLSSVSSSSDFTFFLAEALTRISERLFAGSDSVYYFSRYFDLDFFTSFNPLTFISGPYGSLFGFEGRSAGNLLFNSFSDLEINSGSNFNIFISLLTINPYFSLLVTGVLSFLTILFRIYSIRLLISSVTIARSVITINFKIFFSVILFNSFVYLTDAELAVFNHINIFLCILLFYSAVIIFLQFLLPASASRRFPMFLRFRD